MILTDAGPLVALFDRSDAYHGAISTTLHKISEPLATTLPVLTESFHLLGAGSERTLALMKFIDDGPLQVLFLDRPRLARAFEIMSQYADTPMDFADASLVCMAEQHAIRRIFTLDRNDFSTYRIKQGFQHVAFEFVQ